VQAFVYALTHAVIALVCAVEPPPLSVPVEQVGAPAATVLLELVLLLLELPALVVPLDDGLLLLQAASAAAATSTPAATPARLSFTIGSPSSVDLPFADAKSAKWRCGVASVNEG
jgi:uncharacterized membrane protein YqaE (UPF0057 family)